MYVLMRNNLGLSEKRVNPLVFHCFIFVQIFPMKRGILGHAEYQIKSHVQTLPIIIVFVVYHITTTPKKLETCLFSIVWLVYKTYKTHYRFGYHKLYLLEVSHIFFIQGIFMHFQHRPFGVAISIS
jgi:hypothetical protein